MLNLQDLKDPKTPKNIKLVQAWQKKFETSTIGFEVSTKKDDQGRYFDLVTRMAWVAYWDGCIEGLIMAQKSGHEWVTSTNDESFGGEKYNSKEEAILHGPNDWGLESGKSFYVGKVIPFILKPVSGEQLVESLICGMDEQSGDWSDTWEAKIYSHKKIREFTEQKIQEVCEFIMNEVPPTFFTVEEVERITVP